MLRFWIGRFLVKRRRVKELEAEVARLKGLIGMSDKMMELAILTMAYIDAEPLQDRDLLNAMVAKRNEIAQTEADVLPPAWERIKNEYLWLRGHVAADRISAEDAWKCIAFELECAVNPE